MRMPGKNHIAVLLGWLCLPLAGVALASQPSGGQGSPIEYRISLREPDKHFFHVEMRVAEAGPELTVQMPAWNALYRVRDFAQYIVALRATDSAAQPLPVRKLDKQTWRVITSGTSVTVRYDIYWDQPDAYSSQLNSRHAFLNLASVLCYVVGRKGEPATLGFADVPESWRIATTLRWDDSTKRYVAPNYDELADAPVEIGDFEETVVLVGSARYRIVIDGDPAVYRLDQIKTTIERIVAYQTKLMGGVPFAEYLFLYHFLPESGGGMEHKNSTAIFLRADDIKNDPGSLAPVTAHEFFHLWNVKRIRPQSLEPVDYTQEQYSRALWFAEGVTSTYADLTLVRTGLYSREHFYSELARQMEVLQSRPARAWRSAEEASLDAWLEKYPHYARPEFSISYYNKGELLGILLDLGIRRATGNRRSLDDLMRQLYQHYAIQSKFYDDQRDIETACEAIGGTSFREFFARYVAGTDELPYGTYLGYAGLALRLEKREASWLGFDTYRRGGKHYVTDITADSPAAQAGVQAGDELIALDEKSLPRDIARAVRSRRPGERVRLRVKRGDTEHTCRFRLAIRSVEEFEVFEKPVASLLEQRIREGLLKGITEP
ncbi:MAG TPA: PDZ domain-containing protein [Candidatus Acidoferrales bacterium]